MKKKDCREHNELMKRLILYNIITHLHEIEKYSAPILLERDGVHAKYINRIQYGCSFLIHCAEITEQRVFNEVTFSQIASA